MKLLTAMFLKSPVFFDRENVVVFETVRNYLIFYLNLNLNNPIQIRNRFIKREWTRERLEKAICVRQNLVWFFLRLCFGNGLQGASKCSSNEHSY
jgi:hypothetical protein